MPRDDKKDTGICNVVDRGVLEFGDEMDTGTARVASV